MRGFWASRRAAAGSPPAAAHPADRAAATRPAATPRRSRPAARHGSRVCWLPGARPGGSLHSAVGGWSATTVRSHAASSWPSRRTVRWPPSVRSRSAWKLALSSARNGSDWPSSDRVGVPLPPVTLTVRRAPAGTDTVPLSGLEEDRRQPRIGRRRDPGLQLGRRRRHVARQRRLHRLRQPRRRIVAGDGEGGDQRHHQRGAQGTRIAPRQAGPRQADAQPAHRAHRARDMRLPQRDRRRIGPAAAARRPVGQHRERPVRQARRQPPAAGRPPCRPARRCRAARGPAARGSAAR